MKRAPYSPAPDRGVWTSLDHKRDPEAQKEAAAKEFLQPIPPEGLKLSRRGAIGAAAASAALLSEACIRRDVEHILPYTKAPEYIIPGIANHYATVLTVRGESIGVIVECHEGRPTKIEGNPDHPSSLGAASLIAQAKIMDLYDADRSDSPREAGKKVAWEDFDEALGSKVRGAASDGGAKLRILMRPTRSPTEMRLRKAIRDRFPHVMIHTWSPVADASRAGTTIAFGSPMTPIVDYSAAKVIVSIDCDFLQTEQGSVRANRLYAKGRHVASPDDAKAMSRLWAAYSSLTVTGSNADHRLRFSAAGMDTLLRALAGELVAAGIDLNDVKSSVAGAKVEGPADAWVKGVAKELAANKGRAVVVVGRNQPAHVHALAAVINDALDAVGKTLAYAPVPDALQPGDLAGGLKALAADMNAGKVDTLLIIGCNPVYDAPGDVDFGAALGKVATSVHLSMHNDETSAKCTWHVPMTHELESWGDARAMDGTYSIRQPMIAPILGGKSAIELLALLAGEPSKPYDVVQKTFKDAATMPSMFASAWASALKLGLVKQSSTVLTGVRPNVADVATAVAKNKAPALPSAQNLEVTFSPCAKMHDGRHANNPWLQELPDPLSKLVWDNAALVSIETAKALSVASGDMVHLSVNGQTVDAAVWVMPGQPDHTIAVSLGWGRTSSGRYGNGRGFNFSKLRSSDSLGFAAGAKVERAGSQYDLVVTQDHNSMEGRPVALDATVTEYLENPLFAKYRSVKPRSLPLWERVDYTGHKWGMSIDLNACTGCNACVVACIAENNIAIVGKEQVYRGREMHWLRIDRYFVGEDESNPAIAFQPVACVQCEEAPCENVCPVNATTHSPEGLNDMAYNRCIGTRYCANNCPYKVRRFNYLNWWGTAPYDVTSMYGDIPEIQKMAFNPNVTVRMRGVMEKCTYCVQRIEEAKIGSRRTGQPMKDGSVITACQQTCPTDAIHFGDLNDPSSKVAEMHKSDRSYALLADIGTHPRTAHLGKIRNPATEAKG
jgi:molybdopterin-containing oxidoreductase family iron-sulfur binding subunit